MHIIPAPKKLRKEDFKGKASLSYIMKKKKRTQIENKQTNKTPLWGFGRWFHG